jgi:hypothetical protein
MNTSTLESRNYVATDADIIGLAGGMLKGQSATDSLPREYLRATIATTIAGLDAPQRARFGKVVKIDAAEQTRQLGELEKVIARFYPLVLKKYQDETPPGPKRAEEINSKTNWARGAHRDVRNWIRAGNDLRTVAAARAIKASLAVTPRVRPPNPLRVKRRVERTSKDLVAGVMELATVDKAAAVAEIELLMNQLQSQLLELGTSKPTNDPKQAVAEHRPLRMKGRGGALFMPMTETQVIRQQDNPS